MTRIVRLLVGILAAAPRVAAQTAMPPLAVPKPFVPPAVRDVVLSDGLRLSLVPFGSAAVAYVALAIPVGRLTEPLTQRGIAQVTASFLREGTMSVAREAIANAGSSLGLLGADVAISVGDAETTVSASVLADSAPALVRLVTSMLREPLFPAEQLARLREDEVRQATRTAPAAQRALAVADSLLFDDARVWGTSTAAAVAALRLEDVRDFWAREYRPARARLYVAGVFDADAVIRAAQGGTPRASGAPSAAVPVAARRPLTGGDSRPLTGGDSVTIRLIDRPGASQARIAVAYAVVDPSAPEYFDLNVLNTVMGSVQTARLVANVRERHGYSYNVSSRLAARPGSSRWTIGADVANGVAGAALHEILAEVARIRAEPPTEAELLMFQNFMTGILLSENSTPEGIVSTMRWQELYGADPHYLERFAERVHAVTPARIRDVADRFLAPARAAIVVVGDRKAIEAQLRAEGRVVVE